MIFLLLAGPEGVPPFPEDLADCAVILVGVALMDPGRDDAY